MLEIKKGMKVKNHFGAKGFVLDIKNHYLWGHSVQVIITEPHPLYQIGEIDDFRRQDIKPIFRIK